MKPARSRVAAPRPKCRVCKGTHKAPNATPCSFCDENGLALHVCPDCGEALPLCRCFGAIRTLRPLADTGHYR